MKNSGSKTGKEIVQLYVSDLYRSVSPPARQVKAFTKVSLKPGERTTVKFGLTAKDLSFINREYARVAEKGKFRVAVERLNREFELR